MKKDSSNVMKSGLCSKRSVLNGACCATVLLTALGPVFAQEANPQRTVGFQPLEIHTFKPGSSRLVVEDINQDGLDDVLFANNHISRLEILQRKPGLENLGDLPALEACFEDKGFIVDQGIQDLQVEDLNNDGRKDLITFGSSLGLQFRYQNEEGSFADPKEHFMKDLGNITSIDIADLNDDGLKDLLIARRSKADIYWNDKSAPFSRHKTLTFATPSCIGCNVADVNEDKVQDLTFFFSSVSSPMTVRYGLGDGSYGIEQPVDFPSSQYRLLNKNEGGSPKLELILQNRLAFRTYRFEEKERPALMDSQKTTPLRIGFEGAGTQEEPAWLIGDFNGDKFVDLLVAAPELSRLNLYPGEVNGLQPQPTPIDSLSQVERMSRLANSDVLVISKKEKSAGVHSATALDQFPKILSAPGEVLAGCGIASETACWLVCKDEEDQLQMVRFADKNATPEIYPLDLLNEPSDMMAFALPEGRTGILLFMPYDTPKMYLLSGDALDELGSDSFRAISQQLERRNIHLDEPGNGASLVVTQGAVARKFVWKDDQYETLQQFNPENPQGELIASCRFLLGGNTEGTLFFDRNSSDLVYFSDSESDWGKIHVENADPTICNLAQLPNGSHDIFLLMGQSGANVVVGGGSRLEAVVDAEYTSSAEEPMLVYATDVELGDPLQPMIALIDVANRSIEIIKKERDKLVRELSFEMFLTTDFSDESSSYGVEPHGLESGDLNGDGIGDLIALCQDKLLIYLGE